MNEFSTEVGEPIETLCANSCYEDFCAKMFLLRPYLLRECLLSSPLPMLAVQRDVHYPLVDKSGTISAQIYDSVFIHVQSFFAKSSSEF